MTLTDPLPRHPSRGTSAAAQVISLTAPDGPEGRILLSLSDDGVLRLWNLAKRSVSAGARGIVPGCVSVAVRRHG